MPKSRDGHPWAKRDRGFVEVEIVGVNGDSDDSNVHAQVVPKPNDERANAYRPGITIHPRHVLTLEEVSARLAPSFDAEPKMPEPRFTAPENA